MGALRERRAPFATATRRGVYDSRAWRQATDTFLAVNPTCGVCGRRADTVDHEPPHMGNASAFWNRATWRPMCQPCHRSKTAREIAQRFDPRRPAEKHPGDLTR